MKLTIEALQVENNELTHQARRLGEALMIEITKCNALQKDAERLDYMLTNWLYSLANIAGIPYGNYTPNEDTKARLLVHIDALLKQQEISIGSAHQNNSAPP